MVDPVRPLSSKRSKPISGDFTIRFAPGQPPRDQVFDNIDDVVTFIESQTDSSITVFVDLTAVGGVFTLPVRTDYDFRRVFLDGFYNDDGSIPQLVWPEGARIVDDCDFLRKRDVSFRVNATTTTVWTPNKFTRLEDERAADYVSSGGALFIDFTSSADSVLVYSGGPACGTEQLGGGPLFKIGNGQTMLWYLDQDTRLNANSIRGSAGSTLDLRFHPLSFVDVQPNHLGSYLRSGFAQSGSAYPPITYPGKVFQKDADDFFYGRGLDNLSWRRFDEAPVINYVDALAVNSIAGTFVNRHNFNYPFVSGRVYEIEVTYWWNYGATANSFFTQLLVNSVQQGQLDNAGNRYFHSEDPHDGGTGTAAEKVAGTNSTQRMTFHAILRYTASATGSLPVVLRWGPEANQAAAMWKSLIRIRRVL